MRHDDSSGLIQASGRAGDILAISTLLIDLDGVLRLWPKDFSAIEGAHNLPAGSLAKTAFEPALFEQVATGKLSDSAWRSEVGRRLGCAHPSSRANDAVVAWSQHVGSVHAEVLRLVMDVRKKCVVGLVSNATDRLQSDLSALRLTEHLDFVINSSDVGFAKPSKNIFKHALATAGAQPGETLFVDDSLKNVRAAKALGMRAHHFSSASGLRDFMQQAGLPSNAA